MWTVRTKREGSEALVTDYQKNILTKLLENNKQISSGEMHKHLIEIMGDKAPSRASIIFFMNDLVDANYAHFDEATGKGGYHRLYNIKLDTKEFVILVTSDINKILTDAMIDIFYKDEV